MTPYAIPEIRFETFFTRVYLVDLILYNTTIVHILANYLSVLYGMYASQNTTRRLILSQATICIIYGILYCMYLRVQNIKIYAKILFERHSYVYALVPLYSSYRAYEGELMLAPFMSMLSHGLIWNEHITILKLVNEDLIKND